MPDPLGQTIILDHGDGYETRYSKLSEIVEDLSIDSSVRRGDKLGRIPASFNLWFEIRKNNAPLDPASFLTDIKSPTVSLPSKVTDDDIPDIEVDYSDLENPSIPPEINNPEVPEFPDIPTGS